MSSLSSAKSAISSAVTVTVVAGAPSEMVFSVRTLWFLVFSGWNRNRTRDWDGSARVFGSTMNVPRVEMTS